ncbi:MAG: nucleotidyltransferase family protein [Dehalococcoidales bacterium]|nr:MAG: nucleotidyltransferase family protein [Dehalococcoidales bacterium]
MTSTDVIAFYTELDRMGIQIWIDGGWGVDALLGEQTRPHADLDIVIQQKDLQEVVELLEERHYQNVERDDTRPWNFVLVDNEGREIDFHVIVLDDKGNGIYGPTEIDFMYPTGSLSGTGKIDGCSVRCISPEYLAKFHTGYRCQEKDIKDVSALCQKFGIDYPEEYPRPS